MIIGKMFPGVLVVAYIPNSALHGAPWMELVIVKREIQFLYGEIETG